MALVTRTVGIMLRCKPIDRVAVGRRREGLVDSGPVVNGGNAEGQAALSRSPVVFGRDVWGKCW